MFNRSLISNCKSSQQKDLKNLKSEINKNSLVSNKINIRRYNSHQSLFRAQTSRQNNQKNSCFVKVTSNLLQFSSIEPHKVYEMSFSIRNESSEIQKVRIIPPVKKEFKIKFNEVFNGEIASGLSVKITVIFNCQDFLDSIEDKLFVMGNSFKHEITLIAQSPKANFSFEKILNLGTLINKQERKIQIPIKNKGTKDGSISIEDIITNQYCPDISYQNRSLLIPAGKIQNIEILVKPIVIGQLQLKVNFSTLESCTIKAIVVEDQVQIIQKNGSKVSAKDFGQLFVGQKVSWPFFVSNGTENQVDCILQTINRKKQNVNVKVDKKRNIFISQSSPQQFSASVESSCFSLEKSQLSVKPFQSIKNIIFIQKIPSNDQIQSFIENLTKNIETTIYKAQHSLEIKKNLSKLKDPIQLDKIMTGKTNKNTFQNNDITQLSEKDKLINQTLVIKFSNQQQILKIPIKFLSKIPNLQIDINSFQFGKIYIKESEVKQFVLKNYSNKKVKLTFNDVSTSLKENFKIEGPEVLQPLSQETFKIRFRPLIKKKFVQTLRILVFDYFPIEIKIFGECLGIDGGSIRNQMNMTMSDRKNQTITRNNWRSLFKEKTQRQVTEPFNQTMNQTSNKSLKKTQNTQSLKSLLINPLKINRLKKLERSQDEEIAKIVFNSRQQNMTDQKQFKQGLFFRKQDYLASTKRRNPFNQPKNTRELLRFDSLSLQELKKIEVSEKKLEFGHVFIGSQMSKKVSIKNKLEYPVLFQLDTLGAEALKLNQQQMIKIQACGTYQIDVVLHPKELGELQLPLNYIINKQHIFQIKVLAIVTLVNLQLSARNFVFNFQQEDPSFQKEETLQVYNNGNRKTKFSFQPPENPSFKLSVLQGQLEPKSSISIKIIYAPYFGEESGEQRVDVEKLKLKVHQGAENIIKCTGTVKQPKITIKQTQFKCQNSIISVPITNKICLKNLSKVYTYIKVDFQPLNPKEKKQNLKSLFSCQSQIIILNAEEKKQISFTFLCHQIKNIEALIILSIRGYKIIKIPFSVNLIYPQIATLTPQIDFGDAPIMGNACVEMFSLINMTSTEIKLQIDPNFPKDQYSCEILPVEKRNLQTNYEDERLKTFLSTFSGVFKDNRSLSKRKSMIYNKVLILPPNGEQNVFYVKFVPKLIKKYNVQLPVKIYGTIDKLIRPINLQIKCNAVQPEIYVEPRIIKFDTKVINEAKTSYSQNLYISNPHNYPVKFKIDPLPSQNFNKKPVSMLSTFRDKFRREDLASSKSISGTQTFTFSQYEGEIQCNGKIQVFVVFRCTFEGNFLEKFNICLIPKSEKGQEIKSYQTGLSSYVLDVSGSAIMPTLKFNCNEVIMPVVPLNLDSRMYIMIENHGYDAITVCKWKTSNHFPHTEIKVNFVEGKLLSLAKKSLRIQILFSSLAPISFTTMLEFYDQYGNKYELPLSCTADNSIFTSFPYLESDNQHSILFSNDQKMIKIISTGKNSYYEQNKHITGNHKMGCFFIQKWLNFQLNMNIESYPETIIQSEGIQFVKMVNRIACKNIIKKFQLVETINQPENQEMSESFLNEPKTSISKAKISKILQLFDLYSDTIKKLKQEGAFLNQIRPEFLLSYSDYVIYQNHKQRILCSQQVYEVVSVESWICLFYQLCKIYIEPQINDKIFAKIKVQSSIVSLNLTSNLYSNVEIMLIKFMNFYLFSQESKSKSQNNMVVSFSEQIKIFEVIQRVLQSNFHLSLSEQISSLKSSISTMSPHVFLSTIAKFLHVQLKQYGLSVYLSSTDLFTIGVKQLILYLINLVQMIYHYSNVSCVKFEGAVGDKITKVIELQNPTSKKVSYFVKIVNHDNSLSEKQNLKISKNTEIQTKNLINQSNSKQKQSSFIPEKTQITIEPKQKAQLKVVYHCKSAKGQTSNLYLIPSKQDEDFTIPQPLLFKLTTTILSKILMKKIILSTSLYEVLPIHLDVELPSQIPQSAQFTLSLFEQTPKEQSHSSISFNPPSFIFSQSHVRTLKEGNKDSLELKLVPLTVGQKICKISYFSTIYGEFIYEIYAKVQNPKILKQIKMKELKVNVQQEVTLTISKQNDLLYALTKIYYPDLYNFHCRSQKNIAIQGTKRNIVSSSKLNFNLIEKNSPKDFRYQVEVLDTQFVTLAEGYQFIDKLGNQNKIVLKTLFTKPFKEYPVIISLKNELLKDKRLYKLIFVAISPPKIIKLQFKTTAREQIVQKIPIKLTPCDVTVKSNCECFKIQNFQRQYYTNTEVICHFNPKWIQQKEVMIVIQNKESLQQLIYEITLKAEEPQSFGSYQLVGSSLFNEQVSIPIDVQSVFLHPGQQNKTLFQNKPFMVNHYAKSIYFEVKRLFKRPHLIETQQFYPFIYQKSLKSHTGIYTKSAQNPQNLAKQSSDKSKNPKTRSMVDEKNIKSINMILCPSLVDNEVGSIRLIKPNTQQYYWAKVQIKNRSVGKLKQILLEEKINMTKIESLQELLRQQDIDFGAGDFEFKFQEENNNLKFKFMQIDQKSSTSMKRYTFNNYGNRKRPVLVFSPIKETQSQNVFYFRANNKEYMLPIKLKAQPLPTIVVPEITTTNIQPKFTYLNLFNGTEQTGIYNVTILGRNQSEKTDCFKFLDDQESQKYFDKFNTSIFIKEKKSQDLFYSLKPKQKKQIRIAFAPKFIHQKEKLIIKFQSQTLPNYTYILNGRSQFKVQQEKTQFQVYQNHIKPFHVKFTNLFQKKQHFTIDFESIQKDKHTKIEQYVKIQDPTNKRFNLDQGQTKIILISLPEEYFKLPFQQSKIEKNQKSFDSSCLKLLLNIRSGQKVIKKYELNLFIIKNLFPSHQQNLNSQNQLFSKSKYPEKQPQKLEHKFFDSKYKNQFTWICKARQTVYENIEIPEYLDFFVKQIKSPPQISKYLTFTCISQEEKSSHEIGKPQANFLKLKFSPMKPIKKKTYDLILIGEKGQKYRIECEISVDQPPIDDTIIIKTSQIDQVGCISFKLTNITKLSAKYKAYFVKKLPQFSLQTDSGTLQGYGKPGTPVIVKFKSHINNRRLQDKLILETDEMYWCFKVKGMLSKD